MLRRLMTLWAVVALLLMVAVVANTYLHLTS